MTTTDTFQYRKLGRFGWHDALQREPDGALVLCCMSNSDFGGVSVTEPELERFRKLDRPGERLVFLRSNGGGWQVLCRADDLPDLLARPGTDGRAPFITYDEIDFDGVEQLPVDPALTEFLDRLWNRRKPANPLG